MNSDDYTVVQKLHCTVQCAVKRHISVALSPLQEKCAKVKILIFCSFVQFAGKFKFWLNSDNDEHIQVHLYTFFMTSRALTNKK